MQRLFLCLIIGLVSFSGFTQEKKSLQIKRAESPPKIDAILDDQAWIGAEEAKDFIQFRPTLDAPENAHQKSVVKITYDDQAIYFGAYLYDNPEKIHKQLTSRDNFGASDFFGVVLNPNNDAQNDVEFFVFASGTQADAIANPSIGEDFGWNAVWSSAVKVVEDGWIVEIKIPYSALRFSNQKVQTWGVQFHRRFREDNSQYSWNRIDITSGGNIGLFHGEVQGIHDIKPPTRLSFFPFTSGLVRSFDGATNDDLNFGMDLKYGISENFTLDATLIPDFSQVGFDDVELNLGPFEQQFSEQRQFFTEGIDLFSKGDLFYSRRIGNRPVGRNAVNGQLTADEIIDKNPNNVKTLNAIKVSGRTKGGLGIGFFNAITEKTSALVRNTENGDTRRVVTEPLSNYNILVLDQQFNKTSSVSLINTNVSRDGHFRDANVSALLFDIYSKSNKYNVGGFVKYSHLNLPVEDVNGFSTGFYLGKVSGKWRYSVDHEIVSEDFNINDFGIQQQTNVSNFGADLGYRIFEPTNNFQNLQVNFWVNIHTRFKPSTYTGNRFGGRFYAQTKKLLDFGARLNIELGNQYDYFEPRTPGRFFVFKNGINGNAWFETNQNKPFSFGANLGVITLVDKERDLFGYWFGLEPTLRVGDKFILGYEFSYQDIKGSRGFVTKENDDIVFGQRNIKTIENELSGRYNFNSFHELSLTFRNYWSTVNYANDLFILQDDGSVMQGYTVADINNPNFNFKTWNLDLKYSWQFAPGSQLSALYRNSLFDGSTAASDTYFESLDALFKKPIEHIFSLRIVYYMDYNKIKTLFKGKKERPDIKI